jgi:hypothetical protein
MCDAQSQAARCDCAPGMGQRTPPSGGEANEKEGGATRLSGAPTLPRARAGCASETGEPTPRAESGVEERDASLFSPLPPKLGSGRHPLPPEKKKERTQADRQRRREAIWGRWSGAA